MLERVYSIWFDEIFSKSIRRKMGKMNKRKALRIGTGDLLLLIGAAAVIAGFLLIVKPDGSLMKSSVDLLKNSPFENFLIPGICLLMFNGVLSLIGAYLVFVKNRFAGYGVMLLGVIMIIWISAQVYWIGWGSWLQPAFLVVGAIELALGYLLEAQHFNTWNIFGGHHDSHAH